MAKSSEKFSALKGKKSQLWLQDFGSTQRLLRQLVVFDDSMVVGTDALPALSANTTSNSKPAEVKGVDAARAFGGSVAAGAAHWEQQNAPTHARSASTAVAAPSAAPKAECNVADQEQEVVVEMGVQPDGEVSVSVQPPHAASEVPSVSLVPTNAASEADAVQTTVAVNPDGEVSLDLAASTAVAESNVVTSDESEVVPVSMAVNPNGEVSIIVPAAPSAAASDESLVTATVCVLSDGEVALDITAPSSAGAVLPAAEDLLSVTFVVSADGQVSVNVDPFNSAASVVALPAVSAVESKLTSALAGQTVTPPPRDMASPAVGWIVFGYVPQSIDVIQVIASGPETAGLNPRAARNGDHSYPGAGSSAASENEFAFARHLPADAVRFIVHRIRHAKGYQRDFESMHRTYYGLVQWVGNKVELMEKALTAHHFNEFEGLIKKQLLAMQTSIQGGHYHCEALNELTVERVKKSMNLFDI